MFETDIVGFFPNNNFFKILSLKDFVKNDMNNHKLS